MKIYLGLLVLFCFSVTTLKAQTDFKPGYVITASNDTLIGKIDSRGDLKMGKMCSFKPSHTENIVKYTPDQIAGYRFGDDKFFISKQINGQQVFVEFLVKGIVNIYFYRNEEGDHYYIDKEGLGIAELPYEEGIKQEGNKSYFYRSNKHNGILSLYMFDTPELQEQIGTLAKPDHKSLIRLVELYHKAINKEESSIIYKKTLPFIKFNIAIEGGTIINLNGEFINPTYVAPDFIPQVGASIYFKLPRVNEKIYFRTGLYSFNLKSEANAVAVRKIPIQLAYLYPKGIVRPKVAYGVNIYSPFIQSVGAMAGFDIKLVKNFFIEMNYDIDFIPNEWLAILPNKEFTNSLTAGIQVRI